MFVDDENPPFDGDTMDIIGYIQYIYIVYGGPSLPGNNISVYECLWSLVDDEQQTVFQH